MTYVQNIFSDAENATSLSATIKADAGDLVVAVFATRSVPHEVSTKGWKYLGDGAIITDSGTTQYVSFAYKMAIGNDSITITQATSGRMYLMLIQISGASSARLMSEFNATNSTAGILTPSAKKTNGDSLLWGVTWPLSSPGLTVTTTPPDVKILQPNFQTVNRLCAIFDDGSGSIERTFTTGSAAGLGVVMLLPGTYQTSGTAKYSVQGINLRNVLDSRITWTEQKPPGTTLSVLSSLDGVTWAGCTNGGAIGAIASGATLTNETLKLKIELATTDMTETPTISALSFIVRAGNDANVVLLEMPPLSRFESAAGTITVNYDGTGNLQGEGGSVAAFAQAFTPTDLIPKPDQNDAEHIEVKNIAAVGTLTQINYTDTAVQDMGHIEVKAITATGVLTHIKNI